MKRANEIINDPIKATLFGKFYEKIVARWFKDKEGFVPFDGKPRIYWKHIEPAKGSGERVSGLNDVLREFKNKKQFCTPDGFLQKEGRFYIWEAKNWPLWSEGKKPLDQLTDVLYSMPQILATKAVYRRKEYDIDGILFSWWSKPEGIELLVNEINTMIKPRTFDMFYTADMLEDCIKNQYPWYLEIVKKEKERINGLWRDLLEVP